MTSAAEGERPGSASSGTFPREFSAEFERLVDPGTGEADDMRLAAVVRC